MSRDYIAQTLKFYRKKNNYKVTDVVTRLEKIGKHISTQAVYGWENGYSMPDGECFVELCNMYNIHDLPYFFGACDASDVIHLSSHEARVIKSYRKKADMRAAVDKLLEV